MLEPMAMRGNQSPRVTIARPAGTDQSFSQFSSRTPG